MTDVQLAQNGDPQAFARLISRYQNAATTVALGYLRNLAWSEDIAQDAFVQAWRALPTLRQLESFGPWLLQLVRRNALQALRLGKRARRREMTWERSRDKGDAEERALSEALVLRALEQVPDDAREVLILYYREGQSTRQVAALLSLSESAVRKRLERARVALREEFSGLAEAAQKTAVGAAFVAGVIVLLPSVSRAATLSALVSANAIKIGGGVVALFAAILFLRSAPQAPAVNEGSSEKLAASTAAIALSPTILPSAALGTVSAEADAQSRNTLAKDTRPRLRVEGQLLGGSGEGVVLFSASDAIVRARSDASGAFAADVPPDIFRVTAVRGPLAGALMAPLSVGAALSGVQISMAQGASFDGTARDENGRAVAGATAMLGPSRRGGEVAQAPTNAAGEFHFVNLPPATYDLYVNAPGFARYTQRGAALLAGDEFLVEVKLQTLSPISGHVQDASGAPLANMPVQFGARSLSDGFFNAAYGGVGTDANGNFSAPLFAGRVDMTVGQAPIWSWSTEIEAQPVDGKTTLQIVVPQDGTLTGTLPPAFANAGVSARQHMQTEFANGVTVNKTQADADGHFSFTLPAGSYSVSARNAVTLALPEKKFVDIRAGETTEVSLVESPIASTHVLVTSDGAPVQGATVSTKSGVIAMTDDAGRANLEKPFPFTVFAAREGRSGRAEVTAAGDVAIELQAGGRITGTVVGAQSEFVVSVACAACEFSRRLFVGPEFVWDSAPPGPLTLFVTARDGRTGAVVLEVPTSGEVAVTVSLVPAATISGSVHFRGAPPSSMTFVELQDSSAVVREVAADGTFTVNDVSEGSHVARVFMMGGNSTEKTFTITPGEALDLGVIDLAE